MNSRQVATIWLEVAERIDPYVLPMETRERGCGMAKWLCGISVLFLTLLGMGCDGDSRIRGCGVVAMEATPPAPVIAVHGQDSLTVVTTLDTLPLVEEQAG